MASPIAIQPGGFLESVDGTWSTFPMSVGGEALNVLPSTSLPVDYVVLTQACQLATGQGLNTTCSSFRGNVYDPSFSQTYQLMGQYNLPIDSYLGVNTAPYDVSVFATDTVELGFEGTGGPILNNSYIGGFISPLFWLGYVGIGPVSITFGNVTKETYFQTLRNQSKIPSLSFGYTAGTSSASENASTPSLVFGGYDANRYTSNNFIFPMTTGLPGGSAQYLSLNLNSIATDTTVLLDNRIIVTLDSTLPYMWLPTSVCETMANEFNLTYDTTTEMYFVNNSAHNNLLQRNPTFTFTFLTPQNQAANITVPYSAFDLVAQNPLVPSTQNYFPLKQANNSAYALGRAFLQHAYIVANYDNQTFSIGQVTPPTPNYQPNIVPIVTVTDISDNSNSSGSSGSDAGAIAGGVVGGIVGAAIIAFLVWFFVIRKRRSHAKGDKEAQDPSVAELHGQDRQRPSEKNQNELGALGGSGRDTPGVGSPGSENVPPYAPIGELDTNRHSNTRYELDASQPSELPAEREEETANTTTTTAAETAQKVEETGTSNTTTNATQPNSST